MARTAAVLAALAVVATLVAVRLNKSSGPQTATTGSSLAASSITGAPTTAPTATPTPAPTATPSPAPTATPAPTANPATKQAAATAAITAIMAANSGIDVSISAVNLNTGVAFNYGSTSGMTTGSIIKLDILLTALLQAQNAGRSGLTSDQQSEAVPMIENSDNNAAQELYEDIGANEALTAANQTFGLTSTALDPGGQWGLSTTSAADQILLLKQVATTGVMSTASQAYAKQLMGNVEADQTWGVGVAADPNSDFYNKNGWLAVDNDGDKWLVNSDGIITVNGQTVLMAVLSQHNPNFQGGVTLIQSLAKATAPAVS